ncbi:MAG: acyl-CoA desaturase [Chitinophagaceae bacterium]
MEKIKFITTAQGSTFYADLKNQVNNYFILNKINNHANNEMIFKCVFWISSWIISWIGIIIFKDFFVIALIMGLGHMFCHLMIAFNIAHDANHSALFESKRLNHFFGYFMELLGCNKKLWTIAHNQEHHTFINIHEQDNNIDGYKLLRLCPHDTWKKHHKFQWLYAPFIYALSTLNYATFRDIKLIFKYRRTGNLSINTIFVLEFILFKAIYYVYIFIIPIFIFNVDFSIILSFFIMGHFINGIFLVFVFLTGHLTEETSYPPSGSNIDNNWAVHVIQTTGDYSPKSTVLQWLIGSLNFHVAHHLFPKVCHVHYKRISPIIKRVALSHGYAYREIPTFFEAIKSHFRLLKQLGIPQNKLHSIPQDFSRQISL